MKFITKTSLAFIILSLLGLSMSGKLKTRENRSCKGNSANPECNYINIKGPGGLCVSGKNNNGDLVQENCSSNSDVMWNMIYDGENVFVQNQSGRVMDNSGSKNSNGNKILAWSLHSGNNQKWVIEFVGNGNNVHFRNPQTNKCLDNTGEIKKGKYYHIWDCSNSNKNQWFEIVFPANHKWFNIVDKNGKCVSAKNANGDLFQGTCGNGDDLLWAFLPFKNGYMPVSKSGRVIDNGHLKTNNGNKILGHARNNGDNQLWKIETTKNGKVHFKCVQANKCLDDTGDKSRNYYHLWDCSNSNKNQYFEIKEAASSGMRGSSGSSSSSSSNKTGDSSTSMADNKANTLERNTNSKK